MINTLRCVTLVAAMVATGLFAGLFYTFATAVMPGLGRTDDLTFVAAMQQINIAIVNPWFFLSFFGAPVLTLAAALLHLQAPGRAALPWIVAAFVGCVVTLVLTFGVNIPLNNALDAAGPPDRVADLAQVRAAFEASWVRWNVARALVSTASLGCLAWALVLYGRQQAA